jgi:heme/copper-type cytochrome/quinol oxidase subunit 3
MSFGGLLAAYGALRYGDPTWPNPAQTLGIQLTALMTFLLICSSVTMVEALAAIREGSQEGLRRFLILTVTGGIIFLSLQAYEWTHLIYHGGQSISETNFAATFFILTGFHGCHVFGGVVYLSAILGRAVRGAAGAMVGGLTGAVATVVAVYVTAQLESLIVALLTALVAAGIVFPVATALRGRGVYSAHSHNEVEIAALYWHFVDLIWILVFTFVYLL